LRMQMYFILFENATIFLNFLKIAITEFLGRFFY